MGPPVFEPAGGADTATATWAGRTAVTAIDATVRRRVSERKSTFVPCQGAVPTMIKVRLRQRYGHFAKGGECGLEGPLADPLLTPDGVVHKYRRIAYPDHSHRVLV